MAPYTVGARGPYTYIFKTQGPLGALVGTGPFGPYSYKIGPTALLGHFIEWPL